MLFNSYAFVLLYLPIVLAGFFWLARLHQFYSAAWLALASIFFYGYWNPSYVGLLLGSIIFNYVLGMWIAKAGVRQEERRKRHLLVFAITANLLLLAYFKYANFFLSSVNDLVGTGLTLGEILLPLGISFFTFTQIAFLVDTFQGKVREYNFVHYVLFVTYFPHLIAGPVLHHKEMMPQFSHGATFSFQRKHFALGGTIFVLGLAKKVLLADTLSEYANPVFAGVEAGVEPMLIEAWIGSLAYTLQLYFDFSGYSDMAIGLSLMFNVRLPLNFNSPYKASSIIDFWRRWHMTLSRFLRDYLYIPLGGNRKGKMRRYANLMATMLLGGLWHGAGWTFVIWGGLHGAYLVINHLWREHVTEYLWGVPSWLGNLAGGILTFISVVVAWVFFRAESLAGAWVMLSGMLGLNGVESHVQTEAMQELAKISLGLLIVWGMPNVQQLLSMWRPVLDGQVLEASSLKWRFEKRYAWILALLFVMSLSHMTRVNEFLYFQF